MKAISLYLEPRVPPKTRNFSKKNQNNTKGKRAKATKTAEDLEPMRPKTESFKKKIGDGGIPERDAAAKTLTNIRPQENFILFQLISSIAAEDKE